MKKSDDVRIVDRRTPGTPELINAEVTGAEHQAVGDAGVAAARAGELHVFGYAPDTDDEGNITLYARRSRFDITPTPVVVNMIVLKVLTASWNAQEAAKQLAHMGIRPEVIQGDTENVRH